MRPLVVLVEFLVKPSFVELFRDLISVNAEASLERERGCRRFDVLYDPKEPQRFVLYEIYDDEAAFAEHLASSHYLSFAAAIENVIEQRSIRRLAYCGDTVTEASLSHGTAEVP
jgi:quinol monooxygenase YgiN